MEITKCDSVIEINEDKVAASFTEEDGLKKLESMLMEKALEFKKRLPEDLSKAKNRSMYRTLSADVGRANARIKETAKALRTALKAEISDQTARLKLIIANENSFAATAKKLRAEMVSEVVRHENMVADAEKAIDTQLRYIAGFRNIAQGIPAADISNSIKDLEQLKIDKTFGKRRKEAEEQKETSLKFLSIALELQEKEEAEEAGRKAEHEENLRREGAAESERKLRRIAEQTITDIKDTGLIDGTLSSVEINFRIQKLDSFKLSEDTLGEFFDEAINEKQKTHEVLESLLIETGKREESERRESEKKALDEALRDR